MATASGSNPLRKSCLKRPSCYDDFGDDGPSTSGKPDGVKKQRQSTLQMRPTPVRKSEQPIKKPSESKACPQTTIEIEDDDDDDPVIVDNPNKAGSLDRQKTSEAYVILVHTFNPESISEVTVGQAFHSLEKANEAVADLFRRVKPEFVDIVIDIGVANEFDEGGDTYPDVRRRMTASGRAAYLWHTEEGRGELSVHRIIIE